ncbi:MAG TPA: hypothetical protein PL070_15805 [Flavobacteriales bacterium]|nr:hypothetical protein [Flavobacteriales bacterium]
MRTRAFLLGLLIALGATAQVELDRPLQFNGTDADRSITGLAAPLAQDAAITVEASLIGTTTWAEATSTGMAINLQPTAPLTSYRDGLLLRFIAPANVHGATAVLSCTGLPSLPIQRPDGLPPALGQIREGVLTEVIQAGERWILTNRMETGCPSGTIAIGDRLCIEAADVGNLFYYPAADRCNALGGRLCKWDEFYLACTQYASQMTGLHDAWEWIDDTTNHFHTMVQVGATTCTSQRWANPQSVTLGHSRCCFSPR